MEAETRVGVQSPDEGFPAEAPAPAGPRAAEWAGPQLLRWL